jgi:hypothetical protein
MILMGIAHGLAGVAIRADPCLIGNAFRQGAGAGWRAHPSWQAPRTALRLIPT